MVSRDYFILIKRLLFALSLFIISRILFYVYNLKYFSVAGFWETIQAFFIGLRFDIATTLIANLFFIIFSLIPHRGPRYHLFLKILFVVFNSIFLGLILVDFEFFSFNGKKLTLDIFFMTRDIGNQFFQVIFYYWHLSLLTIATMGILWRYYPRRKKEYLFEFPMKLYKSIPVSFLFFIFVAIGVRGGLQLKSISAKDAFVFDTYELGNFAVNSAYTFARSLNKKGVPKVKFYKNKREALSYIKNQRRFLDDYQHGLKEKQNIVILILESFSSEYIEEGYAPFLKELASKSLSFEYSMANGRRSIEALPSILAGFPSIIGKPFYQSNYQGNKILGVSQYLKGHGYTNSFFHGGKTGTMGFDSFCKTIGFDNYYGLEDYPDDEHYDGNWGVYDHNFFNFMLDKTKEIEKPFLNVFFSLSSHQPYSIPSDFSGLFLKGKLPIHESIGYTDLSLKKFFGLAKEQDWFNNTLFIITADHTQKLHSKKYQTILGRYRVPIIFYHPQLELPKNKKLVQHVDILPSILDFLDIEHEPRLYFGSSVFNQDPGRMFNFNSGNYLYAKEDRLILYDLQKYKTYALESGTLTQSRVDSNEGENFLKELKAMIFYANHGLIRNNIYNE